MNNPDFDPSRFSPVPMIEAIRVQRRYNPIAGLFEFLFGLKKPDDQVLENGSDRPLVERYHTACSACEGHTRTIYYGTVMFGAYAGLVCSHCGAKISVVDNVLYRGLLMVTKPIWRPVELAVGPSLLARQKTKLEEAVSKGPAGHRLMIAIRVGVLMALVFGAAAYFLFMPGSVSLQEKLIVSAGIGACLGTLTFAFYNFFRGTG